MQRMRNRHRDFEAVDSFDDCAYVKVAYLKLALSIHTHPSFTTQRCVCSATSDTVPFRVAVPFAAVAPTVELKEVQGMVLSGNK